MATLLLLLLDLELRWTDGNVLKKEEKKNRKRFSLEERGRVESV